MFQFIKSWQQSGVSQKIFCEQNGIGYPVFYYWLKKFRAGAAVSTDAGFIALQIPPLSGPGNLPFMEMVQADGRRILFYQPVSAEFIKSLIR